MKRDVGHVFVQMFDAALASWAGEPARDVHVLSDLRRRRWRSSTTAISIRAIISSSPNTSSATSGICRWSTGRFGPAARLRPGQARNAARSIAASARCASPATAGVRRTVSSVTPDGEPNLNYLCAGYKAFFLHVDRPMRQMAALLQLGRAPADVMFSHVDRNDPCPCRSGRKLKQCHGRPVQILSSPKAQA